MKRFLVTTVLLLMSFWVVENTCFSQPISVQRFGKGEQSVIFFPGFGCSGAVWQQTTDTEEYHNSFASSDKVQA